MQPWQVEVYQALTLMISFAMRIVLILSSAKEIDRPDKDNGLSQAHSVSRRS
ncbi:putative holin-like toxin [Paenibacillus sp. IHBB 3054]|uniref:putative holin-like toxin n=1 Tax=Paenibacillus sp. IHBB 3054 TaxID=3425689 RepID=UPI003F671EAC